MSGIVGLKKPVLIVFFVLISAFASTVFAVENCADILRFDYATGALIPIFGQDVSPGGAVLALRSGKDYSFYFGQNAFAEYFYVGMQDQYSGGRSIMAVGDVFYRHQNATGVNNTYFTKAKQKPVYKESGEAFEMQFDSSYAFSYKDRSFTTSVMRVSYPRPLSFGVGASVGKSVFLLAETLDSFFPEFRKGAVFLDTGESLVFVPDGRVRFIGSCVLSCSDADAADYYANSTCKSTLADASDYCLNEGELVEFTCSPENYCASKRFSCPFGCAEGKCITGEKAKCDDSDGLNIAQRGRTSGNYVNGSKFNFLDECVGSTKLQEYSCSDEKFLKKEVFECGGGSCENGACTPAPTTAECSDSDGGRAYENSGVCSDSTGSYADSCSGGSVVEYYCDAGYCKTVLSPCSKCADGVCPKSELVPTSDTALFAVVVLLIAVAALVFNMRHGKGSPAPEISTLLTSQPGKKKK